MKRLYSLLIIFLSVFICTKVYAYKSYKIGDVITYNDIAFYVIKDSSSDSDYITLLKAEPLTVDEVNLYGGVGTENNHVNRYAYTSINAAYNENSYGGMAYYSSEFCGHLINREIDSECNTDYDKSDVKYVVDAWSNSKFNSNYLINARLITVEELGSTERKQVIESYGESRNIDILTTDFLKNSNYSYWTMDSEDDEESIYTVNFRTFRNNESYVYLSHSFVGRHGAYSIVVRPVIELYKCAIDDSCVSTEESNIDNDEKESAISNDKNIVDANKVNNVEKKEAVKVPNTLKSVSGLIILIGVVLTCVGLNIFMIVKNRSNK